MLVLRFLWSYSLLMLFMLRPINAAPVNGSLPITLKLKAELASKYGKMLKALISVNEQRLGTMHKLHRLQDLPLQYLRTREPEVYAVWKLDTKPALFEEISQENSDIIEEYSKKFVVVPITTEKPSTTERPESDESGSLEFWNGSKENFDTDETDAEEDEETNFQKEKATEPVEKNLIIIPYLSPLSGSLEFFESSQEVIYKDKDFRRYKFSKDCSKKASKYCKIACKEAFKKMCGRFKCTSQVKRSYKKQCHYVCLEEFVTDSEHFSC